MSLVSKLLKAAKAQKPVKAQKPGSGPSKAATAVLDRAILHARSQAARVQAARLQAQRDRRPTVAEVTRFLAGMDTRKGGRLSNVTAREEGGWSWSADPDHRQRLDHYVGVNYHPEGDDDPEGWDEEGWEQDYAGPLRKEIRKKLDAQFGSDIFEVDIGEKGHVHVDVAPGRVRGPVIDPLSGAVRQ